MNINNTTSKPIKYFFIIIFCVTVWFLGFTFDTGFGKAYDIFGKTKILVFVFFMYCIFFHSKNYSFSAGNIFTAILIVYMIIINNIKTGHSIEEYMWVWLLIPILKMFDVQKSQFKLIGLAYGIASFGVLLIGNVTSVFAGWDGNSVSMVQFFSYTVFMASLADIDDKKNIVRMVLFSVVYLYLLNTFDSRSAQLFSILMLLCTLSVIPLRKFFSKPLIFFALLFPLIIAVTVVLIKDIPFVEFLNNWSIRNFNKPLFNGRDVLWVRGFETWFRVFFIGNGNMSYVRYHNSAVTLLVGAGIIGYIILISVCYKILVHALKWINDSVVYGLATSFLIIWMQQSVELGLISSRPVIIPYMILGLLYARINTLENKRDEETIYNNSYI